MRNNPYDPKKLIEATLLGYEKTEHLDKKELDELVDRIYAALDCHGVIDHNNPLEAQHKKEKNS